MLLICTWIWYYWIRIVSERAILFQKVTDSERFWQIVIDCFKWWQKMCLCGMFYILVFNCVVEDFKKIYENSNTSPPTPPESQRVRIRGPFQVGLKIMENKWERLIMHMLYCLYSPDISLLAHTQSVVGHSIGWQT